MKIEMKQEGKHFVVKTKWRPEEQAQFQRLFQLGLDYIELELTALVAIRREWIENDKIGKPSDEKGDIYQE